MRELLLLQVAVVLCLCIALSGCTETHKVTESTPVQDLNARMSERFPITEFNFKNLRGHVFEDEEVDSYQLGIVPSGLTGPRRTGVQLWSVHYFRRTRFRRKQLHDVWQ